MLFAVTSTVLPRINILAVAVMGILLLLHHAIFGLVYKSLWLSILELSFILNLTVVAIVRLYLPSNTDSNITVVFSSTAVAFMKFIGITVYHIYIRVKTLYSKHTNIRQENMTNSTAGREMAVLTSQLSYHGQMQYREPLLESTSFS